MILSYVMYSYIRVVVLPRNHVAVYSHRHILIMYSCDCVNHVIM